MQYSYEIHQLPAAGYDDDGNPMPAREMDNRMALDDYVPNGEDIRNVWEHAVGGSIDAESHKAALNKLWPLFNRGSGQSLMEKMDEAEMPSLSKNDVVVLDGTAYLCAAFGWEELEGVDL